MLKKVKQQLDGIYPLEPSELLTPHIELCSNREVHIEGCMGIIEYNSALVRINCKGLILKITGDNLTIKSDTPEQFCVTGNILTLDFTGA